MVETNKLHVHAKCEECEQHFDVGLHTKVKKEEFIDRDAKDAGQKIWLTYFDCPHCGRRYFVQVDTIETNRLLLEITKLVGKTLRAKKAGKSAKLKNKQTKYKYKYKELETDLTVIRNRLVHTYNGHRVVDVAGNEYVYDHTNVDVGVFGGQQYE